MPINIGIDDVFGRKKRQRREAEAATLAQNLLEKGAAPEVVNEVAERYRQTGRFELPEFQTKTLAPTNLFPEGIPTRQPFGLPKKQKMLLGFNATEGVFTDMGGRPAENIPEDVEPIVQRFKEPGPKNGRAYRLDTATGKTELIGPNGKEYDTYERWNSKTGAGAGGGAKDPADQLAMNQIKLYQRALMNGDEVSDEMMAATRSAAERFNINLEQVDEDPSILDRIMGQEGDLSQPIPQYDKTTKGKTLTRELAAEFLRRAGGDKEKARKLAREAGHTF